MGCQEIYIQGKRKNADTEYRDVVAIVKSIEEQLWEHVYDNALAVVLGNAEPNRTLNLEYTEIRANVALIQGDLKEATRLKDQAGYLRARG